MKGRIYITRVWKQSFKNTFPTKKNEVIEKTVTFMGQQELMKLAYDYVKYHSC